MDTIVPSLLGIFDYYRYPGRRKSWGGPFNGQVFRQRIFTELIRHIDFTAIVETGTFRGTTTEFMQKASGLPVHTVEKNPRTHGYAGWRFRRNPKIVTRCGDSRSFLKSLFREPLFCRKPVFFYLDAHWDDDLPLLEEIELIMAHCPRGVVMIDDFKVPGDEGYGYDAYGKGKTVDLKYIAHLRKKLAFEAFFPSMGAEHESGKKRGCVVLVSAPNLIATLGRVDTLVPCPGKISP